MLFAYSVTSEKGELNMLNKIYAKVIIPILLLVGAATLWAQGRQGRSSYGAANRGTCLALLDSVPVQALDSAEAEGIAFMREEEKLAHDVYVQLHSKWGLRVFDNISQSEERHFDAIKLILDRYQLPDPAAGSPMGVFRNEGLQTLYGDLIRQGEGSLTAALRVGATIEDLDIRDLENAASATDNNDLKIVYANLKQASENHMRAFIRQLNAAGENYTSQYISQARLSEILAAPQRTRMGYGAGGGRQRGLGRGNNGICPWIQP